MAKSHSKVLLITANVGSIFEDPEKMLSIWLREFLATVTRLEPEFLAIHCQEVGGKNYEESMQHVNKFIKMLLASDEMQKFDRARVFLDEDFTAVEKFTALGSLYFIHESVKVIEIFDFNDAKFVPVEGKEVLSGNIEQVRIKEKAKFAKEFFPDFVWSRKGFIRTRWNFYNTVFDLVNIHLFHDVSNIASMETSPSTYSRFRERALLHTINRFETDQYERCPFFIFGDFNFRLDTNQFVKQLTKQTEEQRIMGKKNNDVSKIVYKQKENGKILLTVGKKDFHHCNHNDLFSSCKAMSLRIYDQEPEACRKKLFEYEVTFPPSYPFSEDTEDGTSYMTTRCPGWCDRIMMSHDALNLLLTDENNAVDYRMIGKHLCMGDHKPIYLNLKIRHRTSSGNKDDKQHDVVLVSDEDVPIKLPVKQVISINGEPVEASSLDHINIHDYMTFEQEDLLTHTFMDSIKRRSEEGEGCGGGGGAAVRGFSFKNVVKSVLRSEHVLEALKHYSHRSDSEPEEEESDEEAGEGGGGGGGAAEGDLNTNANNSSCVELSQSVDPISTSLNGCDANAVTKKTEIEVGGGGGGEGESGRTKTAAAVAIEDKDDVRGAGGRCGCCKVQ